MDAEVTAVATPPPDLPDRIDDLSDAMRSEVLAAVGVYLWRRWGWQTDMANRIRVDSRTVRRWASGQDPVHPAAWELLKLMVRCKAVSGETP